VPAVPPGRDERDRAIASRVMEAIAGQLLRSGDRGLSAGGGQPLVALVIEKAKALVFQIGFPGRAIASKLDFSLLRRFSRRPGSSFCSTRGFSPCQSRVLASDFRQERSL
jgi:hypothetical protein